MKTSSEVVTYLYACPFCSCQHAVITDNNFAGTVIACHSCGAQVKGHTKDEAFFKWQRRKP